MSSNLSTEAFPVSPLVSAPEAQTEGANGDDRTEAAKPRQPVACGETYGAANGGQTDRRMRVPGNLMASGGGNSHSRHTEPTDRHTIL